MSVIREERLWEQSARVGALMLDELRRMQERYPFIGDVRGAGLFLGVEVVKDRTTREPVAGKVMRAFYDDCVRRGLLAMTYVPHIRLQPALTIDADTALEGLGLLDEAFRALDAGGHWRD